MCVCVSRAFIKKKPYTERYRVPGAFSKKKRTECFKKKRQSVRSFFLKKEAYMHGLEVKPQVSDISCSIGICFSFAGTNFPSRDCVLAALPLVLQYRGLVSNIQV